jgi:hypothetical protein
MPAIGDQGVRERMATTVLECRDRDLQAAALLASVAG